MKTIYLFINLMFAYACYAEEITPYKFTDSFPSYEIPASSRFIVKSTDVTAADVVYYFTPPELDSYPIAIVCGGSSTEESIYSIIHVHRYFLKEFLDLNVGVITVEQRGVDGNIIDAKEFMEHYTRSNRLKEHQVVIESLKTNPPIGWNGKLLFLGVSEGGPLVTSLTTQYAESTIATMNWSGAGDWSWRDELWLFLQKLVVDNPQCPHQVKLGDCSICLEHISSQDSYDALMNAMILDPTPTRKFMGMTYKYHADAMLYPKVDYKKIQTPFLVVAGTDDTIIQSSDAFVEKARNSGASITYLRVDGMDHYVRRRSDIVDQSFAWLRNQLEEISSN